MKQVWIPLFILGCNFFVQAQSIENGKFRYLKVAVSNSHAAKPFGSFLSLYYKDFHPGADIAYESVFRNRKKHQWFIDTHVSYMFHRWVQQNLAVYGNLGYRYKFPSFWSAELSFGGGYQLSIPHSKVFSITETEGLKRKRALGRSQVVANLGLAVSKDLVPNRTRLFIEYKQQIQTPFIKEYVPVLPYNILLIGVAIPLKGSLTKQKI